MVMVPERCLGLLRTRFRRFVAGFALLFLIFLSLVVFHLHDPDASFNDVTALIPGYHSSPPKISDLHEVVSITDVVKWLYEPLKLDPTTPSFVDPSDNEVLTIGKNPFWTKPLGKRICFVDVDTRKFDGPDELFGNSKFDFVKLKNYPSGMLGHYTYTLIHGYDYKYIQTSNYDDRAPYWTKPPALAAILRDYDFVIMIDADAQIHYPEVPFEWLLNRWQVTNETAITAAKEPGMGHDFDSNGRLMENGGFIVAQNIPRTYEILEAWTFCPDESLGPHYEHCGDFKKPWPAEQGAFSKYVATAFNETNDVNSIDCDEANGSWGFEPSESYPFFCKGRFISHHTLTKHLMKQTIAQTWAGAIMNRAHNQFVKEKDERVVIRKTNDFLGAPE